MAALPSDLRGVVVDLTAVTFMHSVGLGVLVGAHRRAAAIGARLWAAAPAVPHRRPTERRHPHSLKHSLPTEALRLGAALQDIQDAMGHAAPRTTRRMTEAATTWTAPPTTCWQP